MSRVLNSSIKDASFTEKTKKRKLKQNAHTINPMSVPLLGASLPEEYPGITSNKIDNIVDGIKIILLFESIKPEEAKMVSYKTFTR